MGEVVQRVPYEGAGLDDYNNEIKAYGSPVTLEGEYGFDPGSSSEPRLAGQERVIVEPTLYGPFDMPFLPRDQAVIRGDTYEVDGEVRRWRHKRTNREAGAVVSLRRVEG